MLAPDSFIHADVITSHTQQYKYNKWQLHLVVALLVVGSVATELLFLFLAAATD